MGKAISRRTAKVLLIGAAFLLALIALVSWVTFRNYRSAVSAGNEASAIMTLDAISRAETQHYVLRGRTFGTLKQLLDNQLIDPAIAGGERNGYRFAVRIFARSESSPAGYEAVATPVRYGWTGTMSFYVSSEDSSVRAADKKGAEANKTDPHLR